MAENLTPALVASGERIVKTVRLTQEDIVSFAKMSHDENPLHRDTEAAQRQFGEIIASGQHTAAVLMGFMASHFSRQTPGLQREMLCLNVNFSFKAPVFAEQDLYLVWSVQATQWNSKLGGILAHLEGQAYAVKEKPSVVARATILVKEVKL
jgi:acyl dehydratase